MYSGWELSAVVGLHGYEVPDWQTQRPFRCISVLSLQNLKSLLGSERDEVGVGTSCVPDLMRSPGALLLIYFLSLKKNLLFL